MRTMSMLKEALGRSTSILHLKITQDERNMGEGWKQRLTHLTEDPTGPRKALASNSRVDGVRQPSMRDMT